MIDGIRPMTLEEMIEQTWANYRFAFKIALYGIKNLHVCNTNHPDGYCDESHNIY